MHTHNPQLFKLPGALFTLALVVTGFPLVLTGNVLLQVGGGFLISLALFTPALGKTPRAELAQGQSATVNRATSQVQSPAHQVPQAEDTIDSNGVDDDLRASALSESQTIDFTLFEHLLVEEAFREGLVLVEFDDLVQPAVARFVGELKRAQVPNESIKPRVDYLIDHAEELRARYEAAVIRLAEHEEFAHQRQESRAS